MSPKIAKPSAESIEWAESHRCAICNAPAARMDTEMVEPFRTLKPEYRALAAVGAPAEEWQTDLIGGMYRVEIECENGHVFVTQHPRFFKEKA